LFAEPNMPPSKGLNCQISLRDAVMAPTIEFLRESFQQKFAFDLLIAWRPSVLSHEDMMLNATSLVVEIFEITPFSVLNLLPHCHRTTPLIVRAVPELKLQL